MEKIARGVPICRTEAAGEAEQIARNAVREGFRRVVAAGGDGTINEVVNGLAGSDAALGLLPLGTMNVFAHELGFGSTDLEQCWQTIRDGRSRMVDLPSANGKHFVQLAGIGLDAQAVKETSASAKRNFGPLSYLISAAYIAGRTPPRLSIECVEATSTEASFVLVGNGRLYGGPFPFFKRAAITDGKLDVLLFKQIGYLDIIRYLREVIFTPDITLPEVEYLQTTRLRVSSEDEVPVEVDGELVGHCPVEFKMTDFGLKVLVPA